MMTTRTMTLLLAIALTGGCEWSAALPNLHPMAQQELGALDPVANADNDTASPPLKYPERPPCKVCINDRKAPNQGDTP